MADLLVVDGYDGDVLRHSDACGVEGLQRADCQRVRCDEDRIRHMILVFRDQPGGQAAAVLDGEGAADIRQPVDVEAQTLRPVRVRQMAKLLVVKMPAHDVARSADKGDATTARSHKRVKPVENRLLQIRPHRVEQPRSRIDVDEHAVRQRLAEGCEIVVGQRRRAYRDETVEFLARAHERTGVGKRGELRVVFVGFGFQSLADFEKIGVLQPALGVDVVQNGHVLRNSHAAPLHGIPHLVAGLKDAPARFFTHGKRGVSLENPRHGGLRVPCRSGDVCEADHDG